MFFSVQIVLNMWYDRAFGALYLVEKPEMCLCAVCAQRRKRYDGQICSCLVKLEVLKSCTYDK